ncbi:amidohydrolase [Evansella vedderi]|uniref:Amidohydrolase n=1 Tax=Evansella vedderi TaxID=38282 RepID=A0ABT9ZYV8_9BACI|nr:M20 family metallopeptidase [Evansella vedderi]MDQ0256427.1 amidohydrolase [Evansella vedderi]
MKSILDEAYDLKDQLIYWRRHLHQFPEIGFEEVRTSKLVQDVLKNNGYDHIRKVAKTGVVSYLESNEPGPTIMLRADMDALPIQDQKETKYSSRIENKAHLCGHDAHTSILLGAAILLAKKRPKRGNVAFIFQPAEEGLAGAKTVIKEGGLKQPDVDAIVGLHVYPNKPTGTVSVCPGPCTAFSDRFEITIFGKGGHAAHPHLSVDAITVTSEVISALQQVVSRQVDPLKPVVLTIGKINGGYAHNIIAPSITMAGTLRLLDECLRDEVVHRIETLLKGICGGFGADYKFEFKKGYPSVINDSSLLPVLQKTSEEIIGSENLHYIDPSMGGEDFSYYTREVPGIFFRLGIRNEDKGIVYPNHHPLFDIDEDALPIGAAMLAQFALNYLEEHTNTETFKIKSRHNTN